MGEKILYLITRLSLIFLCGWVSDVAATRVTAEPERVDIDLQRTAVIVIDMQNAFISKGAMFDLRGFDVTPNQKIIEPIKRICNAARAKGVKVIYIAHVLSPDLREVGPDSSFWYKSGKIYREDPKRSSSFNSADLIFPTCKDFPFRTTSLSPLLPR
jgi:hypothetical protein